MSKRLNWRMGYKFNWRRVCYIVLYGERGIDILCCEPKIANRLIHNPHPIQNNLLIEDMQKTEEKFKGISDK